MKNYDTPNIEFHNDFSIPEDRVILAQRNAEQIQKFWDDTYSYFLQVPSATTNNLSDIFPIYRTGDFNSNGTEGFERHTENAGLTSWWSAPTDNIFFIKIISGISKTAIQIDVSTGQQTGIAKSYIILGYGQSHGVPDVRTGEIYPAIIIGEQWGIIINGYGTKVITKTSLFTWKDIDLSLALDLDAQGHLLDARLNYAGIWYGVKELYSSFYTWGWCDPLIPDLYKNLYYESTIGLNTTIATFLFKPKLEKLSVRSFVYATKMWDGEEVIGVDNQTPTPRYAVGIIYIQPIIFPYYYVNHYPLALNVNNDLYLIWVQVQAYKLYSYSSWTGYGQVVFRKKSGGVWQTPVYLYTEDRVGLTYQNVAEIFPGVVFNNNDFGIGWYQKHNGTSRDYYFRIYNSGTWGSEAINGSLTSYSGLTNAACESNNNRGYLIIACAPDSMRYYNQLFALVYSGGAWATTQIDDLSTNELDYRRVRATYQFALVDDQQKGLVSFLQKVTSTRYTAYTRFYDSTGWSSLTTHTFAGGGAFYGNSTYWHNTGLAYNGTYAVLLAYGWDGADTGTYGLYADIYNGSSWSGFSALATLTIGDYVINNMPNYSTGCYIDTNNHIYAVFKEGNDIKIGYYTTSWAIVTISTANGKNPAINGSGDRVLIAWEQSNQIYSVLGEDGSYTLPKRISFYNPGANYFSILHNYYPMLLLPCLKIYSAQYLAFGGYEAIGDQSSGSAKKTTESYIANTGFWT